MQIFSTKSESKVRLILNKYRYPSLNNSYIFILNCHTRNITLDRMVSLPLLVCMKKNETYIYTHIYVFHKIWLTVNDSTKFTFIYRLWKKIYAYIWNIKKSIHWKNHIVIKIINYIFIFIKGLILKSIWESVQYINLIFCLEKIFFYFTFYFTKLLNVKWSL